MRSLLCPFLLSTLALSGSAAAAADLSRIERTIAKEPAYKGVPKYCLLVFGAEAKFNAWLVIDDEAVYVDRNGNGNLTENDKRVAWKKGVCKAGDFSIADGKASYKNLTIEKHYLPRKMETWWTIEVDGKYRQRVRRDGQGNFAFAERPQDAPIIHFDGPLAMELVEYCSGDTPVLVRGNALHSLEASIGTPGLGKGTFAYLIPPESAKTQKPLAEIEFFHRDPKEKPIVVSVRMKIVEDGCLSFSGPIQVPVEAAGNKAKVTLSFADWKAGAVAPRTCEVAIAEPKPARKP